MCPLLRAINPASNYMFKVNNRNTRTRCERCVVCLFVKFEHIPHLVLVFLLLTLSRYMTTGNTHHEVTDVEVTLQM